MHSVRRRLTLLLAGGFVLLTAIAGVCVERAVAAHATDDTDRVLLAKARALMALTEQEGEQVQLDYVPQAMPEFERNERPEYFQFWLADGTALPSGRSRHLPPGRDLPRRDGPGEEPRFADVTLPDGRAGRVAQIAFVPRREGVEAAAADAPDPHVLTVAPGGHRLVLTVARDRRELDLLMAATRSTILAVGGAAALLAVLLVWRILAAGFRPIDEIAAQVSRVVPGGESARVLVPGTPRELAPVVEQVNALVARLEAARERERRFTGNVAHELRTPIAELRALAAVGSKWPGDEAAVEQFFRDVDAAAGGMERLVADLLLLARCQAGAEAVERGWTDLAAVVAAAAARWEHSAQERGLRLDVDVPADLGLLSDAGKLSIVVSNLLGNAVSHARPGSDVRCRARRLGQRVRFEVTNAAELLTAEDLQHLTEPFWRKDAARASGTHAGIGLALVAALAALLGLEVGFDQGADGRFLAWFEGEHAPGLPRATPPEPGRATLPLSRS